MTHTFPSVEARVEQSTEIWARDLQSLFEHAKDRFGDVSWETDLGDERVWGHKAIIYARAPKAFKDRYFISRPFTKTPSLRSPSPSPSHLAPPAFLSPSSLSIHTTSSDYTVRAQSGVLRLTHGDTPELFSAQLEWLYTGEGFGDVVEWIDEVSLRDSLGRTGSKADRRDKLGQDLTYMWRSKLYVDVRIHLDPYSTESHSDSDESTDSLSSTSVFTAHRFILVSRSAYFSSLLLNQSAFLGPTADIHLPTPPFTPASLHFCLGWMYAGHLDFSNRSFDLSTAFDIHRAASYLQLESLVAEIEARIVWDFCHGLNHARCRCRKCASRVARVWRFAVSPEISAVALAQRALTYLVVGWGDCWKEITSLDGTLREELVQKVLEDMSWRNVVATYRSLGRARDCGADTLDRIKEHARSILVTDFGRVADSADLWDLLSGTGFSDDLLETVLQELVTGVGQDWVSAPKVYQILVSSILLKVDPELVLPLRSIGRQRVETAKNGILTHVKRRWMQIRDEGGFVGLENWSLKEIADEIEIGLEELLSITVSPAPSRQPALRPGITPAKSQAGSLGRMSMLSSRLSLAHDAQPEANGLRRLRLSSSASTASVNSRASTTREAPAVIPPSPTRSKRVSIGPRREESGAVKRANQTLSGPIRPLVAKGSIASTSREPGGAVEKTSKPSPSVSSLRSVRTTAAAEKAAERTPKHSPSVSSLRSVRTAGPVQRPKDIPPVPKTPTSRPPKAVSEAPARVRPVSTATTATAVSVAPSRSTATPKVPPARVRAASGTSTRTTTLRPEARSRTVSQATTNTFTSTLRRVQESPVPARPSGLRPHPQPQPLPKASKSSRPAPSTAMPSLHPPASRSASSSTEGPELKTPRTSDPGDSTIRLASDYSDDFFEPPPVSTRNVRKVSSGSTRSNASAWRNHPASAFDPPKRPIAIPADAVPEGAVPYRGGVSLKVGVPCIINLVGRKGRFRAQVKYLGYMAGAKGKFVGIEVEDRPGLKTYPQGTKDGVYYFHVTPPEESDDMTDVRLARQRRVEVIRESLTAARGTRTRGSMTADMAKTSSGAGSKRSASPFVPGVAGAGEWMARDKDLRAMFVRPCEVVYVLGAE